ncbi:hypothetical protein [Companilactobacillus musae]|uniref:hypothetical protein n=1 Tax=Companilactobacillus musae TaxID=1903258 RepID=UPI000E65CB4F|nr:hypothetical protein [Companilactobacillus musae]
MCKFISRLTSLLWALVLVFFIKNTIVNHGSYHITINVTNPQGILGWLFTIALFVTAFDYIYYHLIYPKNNSKTKQDH